MLHLKRWGYYNNLFKNKDKTVKVKILTLHKNKRISLQYHNKRNEYWRVLEGLGDVYIGDKHYKCEQNDTFIVEKGEKHRITAFTKLKILEIQYGEKCEERDIVRLEV